MTTLIICYSLTGHSRTLAQEIAAHGEPAFGEIRDVRERKGLLGYMRSGFESLTGRKPEIYEPANTIGEYDLVVLAAPLWAGRIAAPMRTYLSRHGRELGRYAIVISHGGSAVDKAVSEVTDLAGRPPVEVLHVRDDALKDGSYRAAVDDFCRSLSALG